MKKFSVSRAFALSFAGGLYGLCLAAHAASVPPLLSHRAVYDLELGPTQGSSAPTTAHGRIVYEFTGSACEGYVTTFRQITEIGQMDSDARLSDMRSTTFEDGDGKTFRFSTKTSVDGKPLEPLDGSAKRADDGGLSVLMSQPKRSQFDIGGEVFFPTAQILAIIEAAQRGDKTLGMKVFDGTDADGKVFDTLSVIGQGSRNPIKNSLADDADALKNMQHWPVTISYFDPSKKDDAPNYTLAFDLYENGVSGNLKLDYGDYALNGHLSKFETIAQKPCK
jgi:EipB-like